MSSTFVTLAEVLEARGGPLVEDEIWSLLLGTAETLVDVSYRGHNSMYNIISPASLLLSATGTLAFKNCALSNDVSTFTAPEMLQGRANSTKPAIERMLVYSLGMTLYWSVDYHLPQNQPVQLSDHLNSLLLSMCEDQAHRRVSLGNLLEACESQHKASLLPSPTKVIRQLVEEVFHESMESGSLPDNNNVHLTGRSQMIRERLHGHGKRGPLSEFSEGCGSAAEGRRYSTDSDSKSGSLPQRPWRQRTRSSTSALYSTALDRLPRDLRSHRDSTCSSWVGRSPHHHPHDMSPKASGRSQSPSITFSESSVSLGQRKAKALGPEFIRMSEEAPVILELPGSLVSKKGRSGAAQREINVQLLNGQTVVVRCDLTSRGRDVFDMVVAHANLVEHFYFGLAFLDDDEYFFLDHETKISKVAPDSWKKEHMSPFMLFLRVKFFVDDISLILHRLTRHQYYLQLRRDIMDDRIHCNDETSLFLGALALQAEFGDYMPELYGKNYYQAEHYVSRRMLERMAIPNLKDELPRLHACHAQMLPEEAELEFLKIVQQLPEYGVMFHRVGREKRTVIGELVLGICAKGIVVCEVKNQGRVVNRRFLWRETDSISTGRRKVTIESGGPSGKKHSFMTESSKIAQYILSLCSAQHKFHSEMTSRQLNHSVVQQDENSMDSMNYMAVYQSRNSSMMKRLSCSDGMLNMAGLSPGGGGGTGAHQDSHSKSCTDLPAKLEARLRQQREQLRRDEHSRERVSSSKDTELDGASLPGDPPESKEPPCWSTPESIPRILSSVSLQKQDSDSVASSSIRVDTPTRNSPEREIICVTLKKDPKLGFGFIIVGEDNTGKLDLGIFIASIVPDGPADKDGRIRPGGRLISLNNISLEGVTFSDAAAILQQSPDEIELIVSQPKQSFKDSKSSLLSQSTLGVALERGFGSQTTLSGTEFRPAMEELEEALALSNMATPKHGKRLHIPVVRILDAQDPFSSRSPSICSLQRAGGEQVEVELKKANGSLGISVAGGINTSVRYGGIYIKSLVSGGAAEQDGRIQIGDRLLEVDGSNLRGVTHKQAVECLKKTGEVVSLLLERDLEPRADSPSQPTRPRVSIDTTLSARSKDYSFANQENTMEVVLKKSPTSGLGFSFYISDITSGPDTGTVVRIKRLFAGQPAAESGLLREGDIIISVNGEAVRDLSYQRVLTLLRGAPSEVHLLICRPGARSLGNMDDLLSPAPGNREVRSRSLDIVLDEDYSQLLFKLMTSDVILNEALPDDDEDDWVPVVQPPPAPKAPTLPPAKPLAGCLRLRLDVDRATPSPPAHAPAPPSPPRLPPPSPVSPPTSPPSPMSPPSPVAATSPTSSSTAPATAFYVGPPPPPSSAFSTPASLMTPPPHCAAAARVEPPSSEEGSERSTATNSAAEQANRSQYATTAEFLDNCPNSKSSAKPVYTSGVREEADGSLTYCLMGNGLTILADEEYLTISSTLEPPYSAPPTSSTARPRHLLGHAPSSTPPPRTPDCAGVATAAIGPSHSFHGPVLTPPAHRRTGFMPPSFSSDTLVLGHPRPSMMAPQPPPKTAHPLTTQPPKAQQSLLPPGQYSPVFKASKPAPASPPPPPPIITTQVSSSAAHCSGNPRAPAQPSPLTQNHRPTPEPQRKSITYRDYDDDEDEEEERRKGLIKEFELSVVLNKSRSGSFGFTITRSKLDNCYYIQEVLDNPAKTDGRIRAGDRLIMVNGHDVTNVSDDVAMSVLRSSPRRLSMTLGRAVTNLVARPTCDSLPDIVLYKTPSGQLGIKLTGGIGSKWQGIYCLEVVPGSPASEEGSVRPNDKILYICGRCTLGMTLEDAVKACEIAPRKVKLKVLREDQPVTPRAKWNGLFDWKKDRKFFTRFEDSSTPGKEAERAEAVSRSVGTFRQRLSATEQDSCIMQVEFTKPEGGGLGFSLVGGTNGSMLRVNEICYGGAAEQDGRLRVGDILLEVNGVIVSGLSHSKVVDILRKAEGTVQLTICRDIPCYSSEPPGGAADTTEPADPYHAGTDTVQNYGYPAGSDTMQYYPYPAGSDITAYPYPAGGIMADQPPHHVPEASSSADELLIYPVERPHDTTSDHVTNAGDDVFMGSGPHPRPRLAVVRDETVIDQASSCNSTPSHPACCPSLSVTDILHGASDSRKQFVTTLLDPPPTPKDIRNHQSDGWSSDDDDDDDAFEPNGQETTTPPKGPPIVSEEELASLALIAPCKSSQYSGSRVKALIQILQHQLDQQELVKDFMALEHLKPADNCLVGKAPENRDKNRYRDILPYDKTRVPLGESQDYINASYIRMPVGGEEFSYISCQGPLPATVPAFWQMVWENKSDVIAMMTQEVERGRVKCHKYWPERMSAPLTVGRYQLHLDNHQCLEYFYIKIIRMVETETGETHFVRHLKFTRWPDHGVPRCSEQLVRFIRYLRAVHHKGPVTVHCSAGIGRAGVLICTDIILSLIENDLPINVIDIVKQMRLQRYGMIQTKEQYLFCYKVWLEVLQGILQLHGNQWQPDSPRDHKVV